MYLPTRIDCVCCMGLQSLSDRRKFSDLSYAYKLLHGLVDVNTASLDVTVSHGVTRGVNLTVRRVTSQLVKKSFTYRIAHEWIALPFLTKTAASLNTFKSHINLPQLIFVRLCLVTQIFRSIYNIYIFLISLGYDVNSSVLSTLLFCSFGRINFIIIIIFIIIRKCVGKCCLTQRCIAYYCGVAYCVCFNLSTGYVRRQFFEFASR